MIAEVYNELINKVNKRKPISLSLDMKPASALLGSPHSFPAGLVWTFEFPFERHGQMSLDHKLNCPYLVSSRFSSLRCEVRSDKNATLSSCFSFSKNWKNSVAFRLFRSANKAATTFVMHRKRAKALSLLSINTNDLVHFWLNALFLLSKFRFVSLPFAVSAICFPPFLCLTGRL